MKTTRADKNTINESEQIRLELEQRNAELAVINSVQEALANQMELQEIYELVGEKIRDLFDSQVTAISMFNYENNTEDFQYILEEGKRYYPDPRPIDKIRQRLIDTGKTINVQEGAAQAYTEITGKAPTAVPGTSFPKSMTFVPLTIGDRVMGYVSLQNLDREHAFSDSDVQLMITLANSMSVALENAKLFNESELRNAELAVINSVQEGLVAEMEMQGIYDLVGDKIRDLFDAQVAAIATFDYERHVEEFHYVFEDGERFEVDPRPIDKVRELIINTKELLCINENADKVWTEITGEEPTVTPGTKLTKSALFVPMTVGKKVRGYVSLQNLDRENAFSDSDIRLLSTLANSMSVALENARLFSEAEQRNAELAVINSVQQGLVAEMDMQGIYDLVGDKLRDLFESQVTAIATFDHKEKTENFRYLFEDGERYGAVIRPYDKVRQKFIDEKETLIINERAAEILSEILGEKHEPVPGTRVAKSVVYVPMLVADSVRGYVTLQNLDKENAFTNSDVELLNTLVNSMSVALENARLFNETTRLLAETEQRNAELGVINSVQEGLVREMDLEAIYSLVGNRICEVLNTQTLIIRTFDNGQENWEFAIENNERLYSKPRPLIWANKHLKKTKKPLLINENYLEVAKKHGDKDSGVSQGLPPKSAIFVPMLVSNKVVGSVSLQNVVEENAFTEADVQLLSTLTNSMSVALQNAKLFNETARLLTETEQRASELQTVNNISRAMVSQLEFDALVELVGEQLKETFKADIVYLAIHDHETNMLHFPYLYGETGESRKFGNGITEKIILKQEPLLINQDVDKAYDKMKAEIKGTMVQSFLGVPIIVSSKAIGVVSVQSTEAENRFDEYDQRLLTTIAANLSVAMQNAEAYQKLQEALKELRAAQEQLIQSEKMASLGELTAGVAHEIQNPLNFVNNFSEVSGELIEELVAELDSGEVDEAKAISDDLKQNLGKINHHGQRASDIVKGMLEHSRTSDGKKELVDINKLADEYLRLAYHGLRAKDKSFNAEFQADLYEDLPQVNVVQQEIGRVLLNLINNAFHAVADTESPKVVVKTSIKDEMVKISVKDNGSGIPEDIRDKIFQPFFTTKPTGQGTGLGLSLSYDIITKGHNGDLKVKSKLNAGTEFSIILPTK